MRKMLLEKENITSPGIKFLAVVALVYIVLFAVNTSVAVQSLGKTLEMLARIVPILAIVFTVMVAVNLYIDSGRIRKHLGEESGLKGWLYAIVVGILVSGPPYVLYPLLKDLKKAGMKNSLLAVFLYNRNVKIPFVPAMVFYFGLTYTIVFSLLIIIFSVFNGLLIGRMVKDG